MRKFFSSRMNKLGEKERIHILTGRESLSGYNYLDSKADQCMALCVAWPSAFNSESLEVNGKSLVRFSSSQRKLWFWKEQQCHYLPFFHDRSMGDVSILCRTLAKKWQLKSYQHMTEPKPVHRETNDQTHSSTGAGGLLTRLCLGPWIGSVTYRDKDSSEQEWNTLMGRWTHKMRSW